MNFSGNFTADDLRMLKARRNLALNKMMALSGASANPLTRPRITSGKAESQIPAGVSLKPTNGGPPDRDRSLYDFYRWHFERVDDVEELSKLVQLAERDLHDYTHTGESTAERHRARNRSILSSKYRGQSPEVVAAIEKCGHAHVRKLRKENGLDPLTAVPLGV